MGKTFFRGGGDPPKIVSFYYFVHFFLGTTQFFWKLEGGGQEKNCWKLRLLETSVSNMFWVFLTFLSCVLGFWCFWHSWFYFSPNMFKIFNMFFLKFLKTSTGNFVNMCGAIGEKRLFLLSFFSFLSPPPYHFEIFLNIVWTKTLIIQIQQTFLKEKFYLFSSVTGAHQHIVKHIRPNKKTKQTSLSQKTALISFKSLF